MIEWPVAVRSCAKVEEAVDQYLGLFGCSPFSHGDRPLLPCDIAFSRSQRRSHLSLSHSPHLLRRNGHGKLEQHDDGGDDGALAALYGRR